MGDHVVAFLSVLPPPPHTHTLPGPPQVWYEWALTAPEASPLHNPNGRSYYVGL